MATAITAYSVYYYDNLTPRVGHGMAGRIVDTGSTVSPLPNLHTFASNGDPKVEGFADAGGALRIATTAYVEGCPQPVSVYNAVTPTAPPGPASVTWSSVDNLYSLVKFGSYLYAIDYDNARVVEIDAGTYAQTGVSYTLASAFIPSGYEAHGQALIVIGGALYGLFTFANSAWTAYADSLLVRFTVSGGSSISVGATDYNANLARNAFSLAVKGSDLYVAAIGGSQGSSGTPNPASCLQKIAYAASPLNAAVVTDVMSPSVAYPYEFRDISFKGARAFILMGTYNSSWQLAGKLVSTTDFLTFTTANDFSGGAAGYFWSAQYTADNDRLWFARGNQVLVYNATTEALVATLSVTPGSLISSGQLYTDINDLSYVGALGSRLSLRGYRSPLQVSHAPRALAARALTRGRPELTEEEARQLQE